MLMKLNLKLTGEASERCGVTLFIGIAGRAFTHYRLFGYINYLTASVNATFLCRAFGIRSTSDSCFNRKEIEINISYLVQFRFQFNC
jgi:hypothetical protein